jgi:hypothetical protein
MVGAPDLALKTTYCNANRFARRVGQDVYVGGWIPADRRVILGATLVVNREGVS